MGAAMRGLDTLAADGSLRAEVTNMQTRAELYELLDYAAYNQFDSNVFSFTVPGVPVPALRGVTDGRYA